MPLTENTIVRFFSWWKRGLINPLENILPKARSDSVVLSVVESRFVDINGKTLNDADVRELKNGQGVYLLAPESNVMSRRISGPQKGLPLSHIVAEVLPFDVSELYFASDTNQENIHAIVGSELSSELDILDTHGLALLGVAFRTNSELVFSSQLDQNSVTHRRDVRPTLSKVWPISALLICLTVIGAFVFITHLETQKQNVLSEELAQLQQRLSTSDLGAGDSQLAGSLITRPETRSAVEVRSTLKAVANSLTETTQLDQLILSQDELVLDASAISATQVQANLDESGEFESSEFITSISRSNGDASERFRLKLNLAEGE